MLSWLHDTRRILALAVVLAALACRPGPAAEKGRPPSFVVLLTDDQRWDCLGCMGHPLLKTPNIDRLAAEGVLFENSFVTTSICCVSRASLMTGRLARNHRVPDFSTPLPAEVLAESFPALLKQAGYRTACFGKWGIGGPLPRQLFDAWDAWSGQGDYFLDVNGRKVHNSQYLADRAEDFLRGCRPDQPFCLVVLFKAPHDFFQPDPRDADLFREASIAAPKTATAEHFDRLPDFIRRSEGRSRALKAFPAPEAYQQYVKDYLRLIAGVDRAVGQIMQVLDEVRRADDTLVVYSSDNGYFLGEHGLVHKWLMHEESIRVPLLVRYPQLPPAMKGKRLEPLVLNIDVAPTLLDFAGRSVPKGMDGRSLRPLLLGQPADWRQDFFYEHHFHFKNRIPRTEGVRTAQWKYITYFDVDPPYEELYDLVGDPHEERNLATAPRHRDHLEALRKRYGEYVSQLPPAVVPK
jgi:arylsulfatase A-like enzyme